MATKQIVVVVDGAPQGRDLLNGEIEPGTTARDVLQHFGLIGYVLCPEGQTTHLSGDDVLWSKVEDGAKLRATPIAVVGAFRWLRQRFRLCGKSKELSTTQPNVDLSKAIRSSVRVSTPPARKDAQMHRIAPTRLPLWRERGWKQQGNKLVGAFRTRRGGFIGEIILSGGDAGTEPSYYVFRPPLRVLKSQHAACWRLRGSDRYWVHFATKASLDAGIAAIESQLTQYEQS